MFDRQEREIRKTLRRLSKQRLAVILQPGNVWAIENAVSDGKDMAAILATCYLRGWAEPLGNAIPSGKIPPDGRFSPDKPIFTNVSQLYRLTDSGWQVVHRSHLWVLMTVFIGVVSMLLSVIAILSTRH
jgi:hypothetical protein